MIWQLFGSYLAIFLRLFGTIWQLFGRVRMFVDHGVYGSEQQMGVTDPNKISVSPAVAY